MREKKRMDARKDARKGARVAVILISVVAVALAAGVLIMAYRMPPEEAEAMQQEEIPDMPQSPEDRISELESALDTLLSGRTE